MHNPLWGPAVERQERFIDELRESLGGTTFEASYARGEALSTGDAQQLALRIVGAPTSTVSG
jgi:hypothetical protein